MGVPEGVPVVVFGEGSGSYWRLFLMLDFCSGWGDWERTLDHSIVCTIHCKNQAIDHEETRSFLVILGLSTQDQCTCSRTEC